MKPEIKERIEKINRGEVPEGYKKTKVGVIPGGWKVKKLQDLSGMKSGNSITAKKINEFDPYPCYGGNGLRGYTDSFTHNGEYALIGRQGALCGNVQYVKGLFFASEHAVVVTPNSETDIKWLLYMLINMNLNRYSESSAQPGLSVAKILQLRVYYPSEKTEQQKIASILSTWDKAIELKEKLIEQKKEQKKGLMQNLLFGKILLNDNLSQEREKLQTRIEMIKNGVIPDGYKKTKAGIIPMHWNSLKAEDLFKNHTDKKHNGNLEVLSATQDRGIIPRSELDIDIKYDKESLGTYKKVEPGDFVISLRSFQGGIEYSEYEGLVSPAYTVIKNKIDMDKGYYKYYLKTENFIRRLNSVIYGIRDGKQIGFSDFSQLYLVYPPVTEQKNIAGIINYSNTEINLLEQELDLLRQQKKGLMQLLLTGKVRV